jgi:hypothetical protein
LQSTASDEIEETVKEPTIPEAEKEGKEGSKEEETAT